MAGSEPAQQGRLDKAREAEERRLIEAAQRDPARFVSLYERYFELVYAYVARRTRNRDETEELTAEVFRKALASLPRFKWTGAPFGAWLIRIASNLIADRAKRATREGKVDPNESAPAPSTKTSQEKNLEDSERRARLFSLVDDLVEDQRRVIVMRFAEDKSIREISEELGRSQGAVKQLQFRALQNLRAKLVKK